MFLPLIPWHSLKTRVTLLTLVIFLLSLWSLALYASQLLRHDMQQQLGEQQFSTTSIVAATVNQELDTRLRSLEQIAQMAAPTLLRSGASTQALLDGLPLAHSLFNGGLLVHGKDGTVVAETATPHERIGVNYIDVDSVAAALQEGKSTIGHPVMGKKLMAPVFGMTVPLRDAMGQVVGALSGVVNLGLPNFLDEITNSRFGQTGGYVLVAARHRLVVTATDKSRVMQLLPAPGVNLAVDRMLGGYEGTLVYVNPLGVEVLGTNKRIPVADWAMGLALPTAEAFAPIYSMQTRLLLATVLVTLLAGLLGWWMLRRELAPMLGTVKALSDLSRPGQSPRPLPSVGQQEMDLLINGFNHLIDALAQREALFRQILDTSSVAIFVVDRQGTITQANQCMAEMFQRPLEHLTGSEYVSLVHPDERETGRQKMLSLLASQIPAVDLDRRYWRADGTEFWGRLTGKRFTDANGVEQGLIGVIADITDRKRLQDLEQFRSRILELLADSTPLPEILDALVRGVEALDPSALCSCLLLNDDGQHLGRAIAPSLPEFYITALDGAAIGPTAGSCGAATFSAQRVVVEDISSHPNWVPYRELAQQAGLAACWSEPICTASGQVLGAFAVYHRSVRAPSPIDLAIIAQSARLASIAIEKNADEQKLRDSEVHFRLLTEGVTDVVWRQDRNNRFTYVSPADERLRGYPASEVIGQHVFDILFEDGIATIEQTM